MDLVRNPQLGQMGLDDLNQRYADSYAVYFGEPVYIAGFHRTDEGVLIETQTIATGNNMPKADRQRFQWQGLNVARPQAGWYMFSKKDNIFPYHISYPVKKQYKRGMCIRNTNIYVPHANANGQGVYFHNALMAGDAPYLRITPEILEAGRSVILRPDRGLFRNGDVWEFWFKTKLVADIILADNSLVFLEKGFEQELFEVCRAPVIEGLKVEYGAREQKVKKGVNIFDKNVLPQELVAQLRRRAQPDEFPEQDGPDEEEIELLDEAPLELPLFGVAVRQQLVNCYVALQGMAIDILRDIEDHVRGVPFAPFAEVEFMGHPDNFRGVHGVYMTIANAAALEAWRNDRNNKVLLTETVLPAGLRHLYEFCWLMTRVDLPNPDLYMVVVKRMEAV